MVRQPYPVLVYLIQPVFIVVDKGTPLQTGQGTDCPGAWAGGADPVQRGMGEAKNRWGWGGFVTRELQTSQIMAHLVALIYNWWSLFVRLADLQKHTEAITSRPLLLSAIGRQTRHAYGLVLLVFPQ